MRLQKTLKIISLLLLITSYSFAQSPYLSFKTEINGEEDYILELKMWDLSRRYDTSFLKDQNKIIVADSTLEFTATDSGTSFELGNQWFTTDRVFGLYIIERDLIDTMLIVFAVEEYSWVTNIDLGKLDFKPGCYEVPITYTRSKENNYISFLTINNNYNLVVTAEKKRRFFLP